MAHFLATPKGFHPDIVIIKVGAVSDYGSMLHNSSVWLSSVNTPHPIQCRRCQKGSVVGNTHFQSGTNPYSHWISLWLRSDTENISSEPVYHPLHTMRWQPRHSSKSLLASEHSVTSLNVDYFSSGRSAKISPGITLFLLSIHLPHLSYTIPCSYWSSTCQAALSSYMVSVRQTKDLSMD